MLAMLLQTFFTLPLTAQTTHMDIKQALAALEAKARTHFALEALQLDNPLPALFQEHPYNANEYTPFEIFLIVETVPGTATQTDSGLLAGAYAAAVQTLTPDWWGYPGDVRRPLPQQLLKVPGVVAALQPLLSSTSHLQYLHGEANALSTHLQWQRGDLAAGLLAHLVQQPFDAQAPLEKRQAVRRQLATITP